MFVYGFLSSTDLQDSDFGMYKCISKNSIAETDGSITLNSKTVYPVTYSVFSQRTSFLSNFSMIHYFKPENYPIFPRMMVWKEAPVYY